MNRFDIFVWRSLFVSALLAALMVGAGLWWLVARIRARDRLPHARSMPGTGTTTHSAV